MGANVFVYKPYIGNTDDDDFISLPEGDQVLGINNVLQKQGASQQLTATFQAGSQYSLSVKVGSSRFANDIPGFPGYKIELAAGGTVIATASGNHLSVPLGEFITVNLIYNFDVDDVPLDGQPLQIRLLSGGGPGEVAFDDVKLIALLANPVADAGGPYFLSNPATDLLSLDGSASLPSGDASIVLYQWDLNNDGVFDDATGATPAAISFEDLMAVYGMVDGSNTIQLRVTDSDAKTAIAQATVELVTSTKYTGPNGNNSDTWDNPANWDNGLPEGDIDVVILAGKSPFAWGNGTPIFTGNLTLQNNARLTLGWSTQFLGSYNALGTPGQTRITMNPGSSINTRTGGTPVIPEMILLGDASFTLGSSTQGGAQASFDYPISGPYQFLLQGNNQTNCVANLNASNSFNRLLASGTEGGLTIRGNAAGSLGTGDVTIAQRTGQTASYAILEMNATNAMARTGTLSISGSGTTLLRMNANNSIARFILNGVEQAAGTYGGTSSSATFKFSWITGPGILTVGPPPASYWDLNGTTAGAGGETPSGVWNATNTFWNSDPDGSGSVTGWTQGNLPIFSAGSDATGVYEVEVEGTRDISGLIVGNGEVDFTVGASGVLRLTADSNISVGTGTSSIATPIQQSGTRALTKSGVGDLIISGNLAQTGGTSLLGGNMALSGNNSSATGATSVASGVLRVDAANSIPGTSRNLTVNASGSLVFGPSFGAGNIENALNNRVVASSAGTIAADYHAGTNFDFSTAGFTAAYFGAESDLNYTGTLTPNGTAYRLSGNGGTLTMANTNALTGARTLTSRGNVVLAADNNYTGATTVLANSSLSILGASSTTSINLQASSTLALGHNHSLGTGTLTISGAAATLKPVGSVVASNPVSANADFIIAGGGTLELSGTTTINNNRIISSRGNGIFGAITRDGSNNRSLTVNGPGNVTVAGDLTLGTGALTRNDSGTLILQGTNTYGSTSVTGGTLRMEGVTPGSSPITLNGARLQLGSESNGGISAGTITLNNSASVIEAVGADRIIANNIDLLNNITFSGNQSLTVNGWLRNNNFNRSLTNSVDSNKLLVLGDIDLSQNTSNRTLIINGSGNTMVDGVIANGGGSTAGNLTKNGSGTLILNNANTYAGNTVINNGKLFVNGSTGTGNLSITSDATLGGTGTIGGNTTIASGGRLEFDINSAPGSHQKLQFATGRSLTFSGTSTLSITGIPDVGVYTLLTAPGGINGSLPAFDIPDGWDVVFSKNTTDLILTVNSIESNDPDPTVSQFLADLAPGQISINTPVTYTVIFDQAMNVTTVNVADFGNQGTAAITIGPITAVNATTFSTQVIPTSSGTLRFRINSGATLRSAAGLNVNTSAAILQANTYDVVVPADGTLSVTEGDLVSSGNPGGPFSPTSRQYTLLNFGATSLNWSAGKAASWLTLEPASGTLNAGESITVTASINSNANTLSVGTYVDTISFTNTTNGNGNTSRAASVTVNGLPVQITVGNLTQTYDGTPKSVTVSTNPADLAYTLTYNGQEEEPVNAGLYDVFVVVTDPNYTGSASRTLTIARAPQTIDFAALDPIFDDQETLTLNATSTSGLPVSYTSSEPNVATVSGNIVTLVGIGSTTITASQSGNENYQAASSVQRTLQVVRSNPLAVPGGPYTVSSELDLALDGSQSVPSYLQTIALYEWDLNNDGIFDDGYTGATPGSINLATLEAPPISMSPGINAIRLRVTDTAGKTSTVTTTVTIIAPLRWDANTSTTGAQDGGGSWTNPNQWWTGSANVDWTSGSDAVFGNGGTGGVVGLGVATSVGTMDFESFNGTYTMGTTGRTLTINKGITKSVTSAAVILASQIALGGDQTWLLNGGNFTQSSANDATIDLGAHTLTIDNQAGVNLNRAPISGTGGIIKNGDGRLILGSNPAAAHTFEGGLTLNGGVTLIHNNIMGSGNLTMNGGVLDIYWNTNFIRSLGSGAGQIKIIGGESGFSLNGNTGTNVILNNNASTEVVWGSEFFAPSVFVLQSQFAQNGSSLNFQNRIDLNGEMRTVRTFPTTGTGAGSATISGVIRNSNATPAGLIKTGAGRLNLNAANTYNGGTVLEEGTLQLGNLNALGSSVGALTVNGGILNLNNYDNVTVGSLTGSGGIIANNGGNARTFIIGNGGGTGGNFHGVIANNTNAGAGTLALNKTGTGAITLSGNNTYTGATNIKQGKLFINGSIADGNVTVAGGATLGGNGSIGGDTTIAVNGKLEFNLSSAPGSHDPLNIANEKTLTLTGASELTITSSGGVEAGTYILITGGNNIVGSVPATVNLPVGWEASVSIAGNELILEVADAGDTTPPTLVSIVDDQGGNPIVIDTLVTYTVTFDEDIDVTTVSAEDFTNNGTAAIIIGAVNEISAGVFTVQVTPTTTGTLQLRIPTSAEIRDLAGNTLVVNPPLDDDTIITVNEPVSNPFIAWGNGAPFDADTNGDGVPNALAWFLGASGPTQNARALLPVPARQEGKMVLAFYCLKPADRGDAVFKVQFSSDLGQASLWTANEAEVPGVSSTVGNIVFHIEEEGSLIYVEAKMDIASGRMFGRLIGEAVAP